MFGILKQVAITVAKKATDYSLKQISHVVDNKMEGIIEKDIEYQLNEIHQLSIKKYREGCKKHGIYEPEKDTRNILEEAENELIDTLNYTKMGIIKLRILRRKLAEKGITL